MREMSQHYLSAGPLHLPAPTNLWQRARKLAGQVRVQFIALVAAPTILSTLYFGLIAAPQYVSHCEYIVRGVDAHRTTGLAAVLSTFGVSRAADEISAIESYLKSRDVMEKLNAHINLHAVYGSKSADWFSRFPRLFERDSFENLYLYSRSFISVQKDPASGVTALDVATFDPASARDIARFMLAAASTMANNLNARAERDLVDLSKRDVEEARNAVVKTQSDLTAFRDQTLLVDPLAFAGAVLQDIGSLSLDRARAETQITQAETLSPNNPSLVALKATQNALARKVEEERAKLAGSHTSLSGTVANYEKLTLLRDLAQKRYASALVSLQAAEADAQRKRIYIEEVVAPNLPDEALRPERLRSIVTCFVIGFMAFAILWILTVGSKDHAQ